MIKIRLSAPPGGIFGVYPIPLIIRASRARFVPEPEAGLPHDAGQSSEARHFTGPAVMPTSAAIASRIDCTPILDEEQHNRVSFDI